MLKRFYKTIVEKKGLFLLSIFFGVNLAFYFSAYLENSPIFIPLGSTRMWACIGFISGVGVLVYFMVLLWAENHFRNFLDSKYIALSLLFGAILFFANTSKWLEPGFYVRATLPISYELHVPWYASVGMAHFTGIVFFATLVLFLFALLLPKRDEILSVLDEKLSASSFPERQNPEWWLVVGFVLAAFLLRVYKLELLPPHLEEYQHLIAAKQLLAGMSASDVYQRGFYLVTTPVKLMFTLIGTEVWAARLPGVIVNSLAIVPLYWLMRRYNKKTAIISAVFFITSPWIIALSRPVREYAYQPLMYYLVLASALYLLSNIRKGFLLLEWRSLFVKKNLWAWGILVFFIFFVLLIDRYSSFKVVALLYLTFGLFVLARLNWRDKINKLVVGIVGGLGVLSVGVLSMLILTTPDISEILGNPFKALQVADLLDNFRNGNALLLAGQFFFQPPTQWYHERILLFPLLSFLFAVWWGWRTRKSNSIPWFLFVLYMTSFTAFAVLYTYIYAPRFFQHLQLWYIPLLALGIYGWYLVSTVLVENARWRTAFWVLVLLVTVNFPQLTIHTTGAKPVTFAIHMGFDELQAYMLEHAQPEDVLLAKFYGRYVVFEDTLQFINIYEASFDEDLIAIHDSGWLVVDESRHWAYRKVLKLSDMMIGDVELEYVGEFADPISRLSNFVWHWDKTP